MPKQPLDRATELWPSGAPLPIRRGLIRLLQAHDYARVSHQDVWDFAVPIRDLSVQGMTTADFLVLIKRQLLQHCQEITPRRAKRRCFKPADGVHFHRNSCFVLTPQGVQLAREVCAIPEPVASNAPSHVPPTGPYYDSVGRTLYYNGQPVKIFRQPAPSQERVLLTFQAYQWAQKIPDPSPLQPGQNPKVQTHRLLRNLNRGLKKGSIRFGGDGSGRCIVWHPC